MRTIKFRAWDKKNKEMVVSPRVFKIDNYGRIVEPVEGQGSSILIAEEVIDWELMQFTGLKDKNEVEIYEGDIVKYEDKHGLTDDYDDGVVEFKKGCFGINDGDFHDFGIYTGSPGCDGLETMEVIGNIYEAKSWIK